MFGAEGDSVNVSLPAEAARRAVPQRPPRAQQACFTKDDDERLRAILEGRQFPLKYGEWGQVAKELGKFTGEQVREHFRSLGRRLQVTAITVEESRDVVRRSVAETSRFKRLAQGIRVGRQRSPELIRMALTEIYERLKLLGFKVRTADDADLLPDEVLKSGVVPAGQVAALLREYNEARARRRSESGESSPDADSSDSAPDEGRTLVT